MAVWKLLTAIGAAALAATLSGCWVQPGFDASRSNWNRDEATITAANVDDLELEWEAAVAGVPAATYGDRVYVQDGVEVSALDATTGATRWSVDLQADGVPADALARPLAVADGTVWVPLSWPFLRGGHAQIDAGTGAVVDAGVGTAPAVAPPAVVGDRLVGAGETLGPSLIAIASVGFTYTPTLIYSTTSDEGPGPAFAIVDERVAWSFGTLATGFSPACPAHEPPGPGLPVPPGCAPDWQTELGATPTAVAGVGLGHAAYTDESGTLTVIAMLNGAVAWTAEVGTPGALAVAGGTIFVGTDDGVAAFPAQGCALPTCTPVWTLPGRGTPIVGGDVVYVNAGGEVLAFPRDGCGAPTCTPLATLSIPGTSVSVHVVDGGRVIGATGDGRVVAFGLPG